METRRTRRNLESDGLLL